MRDIAAPGFADDDGSADAGLSAVLSAHAADPDFDFRRVLEVFQYTRVVVPVVARLGEVEYDRSGLAHDKTSDMATVLTRGKDGRLGMFAFTSTAALAGWRSDARPVPVSVPQAAAAALADGAEALVVDLRGPVFFVVGESDLRALANGQVLVRTEDSYAWFKRVRAQD